MRTRLRTQVSAKPPASHASFGSNRPCTRTVKAIPIRMKPTRPLAPEHAEEMLTRNGLPACVIVKTAPSPGADWATGIARMITLSAATVRLVKLSIQLLMPNKYGIGQASHKNATGALTRQRVRAPKTIARAPAANNGG